MLKHWLRWAGVVGVALAVVAAGSSPAVAAQAHSGTTPDYLALGDSVPFGYNPFILPPLNPAAFVGYPEDAAAALHLKVANASCPGQASGGFLSPTGTDNGCRQFRGAPFPLHVSYTGTQLQFARSFLTSHPNTALVTLTLGANDLFVCRDTTADRCAAPQELGGVLRTYRKNLTRILSGIRTVYHGRLVAVTYYSTNYADPAVTVPVAALNAITTEVLTRFDGQVADGFTAFARAAAFTGGNSCAAGLLIKDPRVASGKVCDIHPSPAGAQLLAATLAATVGADGDG